MASTSRKDSDEFRVGRAKRSRAGSLHFSQTSNAKARKTSGKPSSKRYTPQAVVKVAGWATAPSSVKRMLDYIGRTEGKENQELVDLEAEDGVLRRGQLEVDEIYDEWKHDFKRKPQHVKKQPRHAVHLILSASAKLNEDNIGKTLKAARRVAEKHFGEPGYKYALGVHQDGKYPHVHMIVNTVNTDRQAPKLRLGKKQIFEMRQSLATELTREGLDHVATRGNSKVRNPKTKGAKPNSLAKVKKVLTKMDKEQRQFERALTRKNPRINAIQHRQQQAKVLDTLRAQVKDDSSLNKEERLEAFNRLRKFRRGIEKKGVNVKIEIQATVNFYEVQFKKWKKNAEQFKTNYYFQGKKGQKDVASNFDEKSMFLQKKLERFLRKDLKQQNIPVEVKKAIHKQLRPRLNEIKKVREMSLGNRQAFIK
ncbi:relaxase/mobilization nuclease domain-containing protein [Pseudodesulfovibrio sp. JC047]|uniref:relaxase/mobilization nuclease domain-containing protein n=1 Tax=Pseudodesulfovibrio sp. JC047 TaxID=2683199 RepID=UPI0013D0F3DD|nr:relaxase/mobilization nuclease domain-containing protein [Pseudodesulfovibrio sp. JC047]NDV20374.1 relaxase/mobilization nuclease domain-containing protein [Pseudodesulfovibrio sp. JC047]